jgi:hypothetical protein
MPRLTSDYSEELAQAICSRLAEGASLRQICASQDMPDSVTVLRWLDQHSTFRQQYARAREVQAEHWADEIIEIADNAVNDWEERERKDGTTSMAVRHDHISRAKLRIDTRKWLMSRLVPKKYGDTREMAGKEEEVSDLEAARAIAFLFTKALKEDEANGSR